MSNPVMFFEIYPELKRSPERLELTIPSALLVEEVRLFEEKKGYCPTRSAAFKIVSRGLSGGWRWNSGRKFLDGITEEAKSKGWLTELDGRLHAED